MGKFKSLSYNSSLPWLAALHFTPWAEQGRMLMGCRMHHEVEGCQAQEHKENNRELAFTCSCVKL